jgi:8-oxo-dGTP pyrophosphatase MutT (NUDIX family)
MPMSPYYRELRARTGTELLLIPAVAAVVRDDQGRVLIQRSQHGVWSLPAGAIEPGESPAEAAAREVYEETGLRVRVERVLGVFGGSKYRWTYSNGDRVEGVVTVFECVRVSGALIGSNEETAFLEWFRIDELPELAIPYPDEVLRGTGERVCFEWDDAWARPRE